MVTKNGAKATNNCQKRYDFGEILQIFYNLQCFVGVFWKVRFLSRVLIAILFVGSY